MNFLKHWILTFFAMTGFFLFLGLICITAYYVIQVGSPLNWFIGLFLLSTLGFASATYD